MKIRLKEFFYIPNLLTLSRILFVIPLAYLIKLNTPQGNVALAILATIAASTDFFDGLLSRKLNQVTELGIVLDPLADKIGMGVLFVCLILYRHFPIPLVVFLIYRDIMIVLIGGRILKKSGRPVMANFWGKLNTTVLAATGLFFIFNLPEIVLRIFLILSYITIFLSGIFYAALGQKLQAFSKIQKGLYWLVLIILTAGVIWMVKDFNFLF